MKKAQVQTEVQVAEEDIDDVVGIAMKLMDEDEGQLSLEEVQEVGEELDIPPEYIERAQAELKKQRALEAAEAREEKASASNLKRNLTIGGCAVAGVLVLWAGAGASSLGDLHAQVEAQAAQVENVKERKAAVVETYKGRADSTDRDAELVGAENRIRVEAKRYSDVAAKYNASAGKFPVALVRPVFGLPGSVPLRVE